MKLISAKKYNIYVKDWHINHIKRVEEAYCKLLRDMHL